VQVAGGLPHHPLAATVVAGRGRGALRPRDLLHRRGLADGVEQLADEGFPEIVGRDLLYLRLLVEPLERLVDRLIRERVLLLALGVAVLHLTDLPHGQTVRSEHASEFRIRSV
jgi:hypothetical protein